MDNLIKGLCESQKFSVAYQLALRRETEGLITEEELNRIKDWIHEYQDTGVEPIEIIAKKAMTAAERKAKSRAKAKSKGGEILGGITLTSKAADQLSSLCFKLGINKSQVINKLLEEQEQLKLL
jgi:hypothetical protein